MCGRVVKRYIEREKTILRHISRRKMGRTREWERTVGERDFDGNVVRTLYRKLNRTVSVVVGGKQVGSSGAVDGIFHDGFFLKPTPPVVRGVGTVRCLSRKGWSSQSISGILIGPKNFHTHAHTRARAYIQTHTHTFTHSHTHTHRAYTRASSVLYKYIQYT